MIVGAGPGSTAGGFKVSTLSILVLRAWASFRGRQSVTLFHRTISRESANQAIGVAIVFAAISTAALLLLLGLEQSQESHVQSKGHFLDAVFEVISALGTVGLSTGFTTQLGSFGRLIIIGLMFIGRLGPITVFSALSRDDQIEPIEYASQEPLIG
jgi:trk system potassium uptake protein TrkH